MASLFDITELLCATDIEVEGEASECFFVKFLGGTYSIPKTEVDWYLGIRSEISNEPPTTFFSPGYYEHLVDLRSLHYPLRRMSLVDGSGVLTSQDSSMSLELSPMSFGYFLKVHESQDYYLVRRRLMIPGAIHEPGTSHGDAPPLLGEAFRRLLTIKLRAAKGSSIYGNKGKLRQVAEAALFHFSYGTGMALSLSRSWERTYYRLSRRRAEMIQFPKRTYESSLISYYELALSSDSLMLSYIALYKILEHFFSSASEKDLFDRLIEKLVVPEFSHTKKNQLRDLVDIVRKHDQRMDEPRMLATVIEHFFRPDEIASWVSEYENAFEPYYTVPQEVFKESYTLDLNPDRFASSLAKRVYHIRNALVHNKEGELPKFIPFSGEEATLSKEIPILLFVAEQLILRSGRDI